MSKLNFKSTEELISLVNTSDLLGDHRDEFLKDIQAKPDIKKRISAIVVYWVYLKWAKLNRVKPIHRNVFFRGFRYKYKQRRYNVYNYYYINSNHFELTEEEKSLMWQQLNEEKEKEKYRKRLRYLRKQRREKKLKEKSGLS